MSVAVYTITKATTEARVDLAQKSIGMLRRWAGVPLKHYVFDNGSSEEFQQWLLDEHGKGRLHRVYLGNANYGQNIGANFLLDWIEADGADWVVRWDDDCVPRTRRFLKKMVHRLQWLRDRGAGLVVGYPDMRGLENPPEALALLDGAPWPMEIVPMAGQCRVHPAEFFDGWRFNKFAALGFGEAAEVAERVEVLRQEGESAAIVRLNGIEVWHGPGGTVAQEEEDPEYHGFEQKVVPRYVGFGL